MGETITQIEQAEPTARKIQSLYDKRKHWIDKMHEAIRWRDSASQKEAEQNLSNINSQLKTLEKSIEYVKIKCFIEICKTKFTKDEFEKIWQQCDDILANPSMYLS